MLGGDILTRGTIWLAVTLYVAGEAFSHRRVLRRFLNTAGCGLFLAHVACAFEFYHSWSHSAAYSDTARQTAALVGWNSGTGLYVNYLFGLVWMSEVLWSWTRQTVVVSRLRWITITVRAFFWFMIFNGAVVFAHGPMRVYGLLLSVTLVAVWWPRRNNLTRSRQ